MLSMLNPSDVRRTAAMRRREGCAHRAGQRDGRSRKGKGTVVRHGVSRSLNLQETISGPPSSRNQKLFGRISLPTSFRRPRLSEGGPCHCVGQVVVARCAKTRRGGSAANTASAVKSGLVQADGPLCRWRFDSGRRLLGAKITDVPLFGSPFRRPRWLSFSPPAETRTALE